MCLETKNSSSSYSSISAEVVEGADLGETKVNSTISNNSSRVSPQKWAAQGEQ